LRKESSPYSISYPDKTHKDEHLDANGELGNHLSLTESVSDVDKCEWPEQLHTHRVKESSKLSQNKSDGDKSDGDGDHNITIKNETKYGEGDERDNEKARELEKESSFLSFTLSLPVLDLDDISREVFTEAMLANWEDWPKIAVRRPCQMCRYDVYI